MKIKLFLFLTICLLLGNIANSQSQLNNGSDKINLSSQHSLSYSYRPENVSIGVTNNNSKSQVVISGVPSYLWQRGCGPTSLGMVIGYYDLNGYSDLIAGDASTQTADVNNAIANSEHYNDYSLPLDYSPNLIQDKSQLGGAHTSNCIADYMHTSWSIDGNYWGWSYSNKIATAFTSYVQQQNSAYTTSTSYVYFATSGSWDTYKTEIDNNRPVVFLVDSDGDGSTDHFVTGLGYDNASNLYAIYDTWDHNIHWYTWHAMTNGNAWGIYGFTKFTINGQVSLADLVPYQPSSTNYTWDSKIIVKNITVTDGYRDMHDDQIHIGDNIYVSFSYYNNSSVDIYSPFTTKIYVDGNEKVSVDQTQTLQGYYYWMYWNFQISNTFSAGTHTISMTVDANNSISESDEINNVFSKTFNVSSGSGIDNAGFNTLSIYPNPATDFIEIKGLNTIEKNEIEIYNTTGQKIDFKFINSNQISISNLPAGVYFIKIATPNATYSDKFIKQ